MSDKSDSSLDGDSTPTRRAVLRGGVTALGTTVAVSGVAAASDRKAELYEQYSSPGAVERAFRKFGDGVVSRLRAVDPELVPPTAQLSVERVVTDSLDQRQPREGSYVGTAETDGVHTAHLTLVRTHRQMVVRLVVEPETERAYAFLRKRNGDLVDVVTAESTTVSTTADTNDVTTTGCTSEIVCDSCCGFCGTSTLGIEYEEICCDDDFPGGCYRDQTGSCCSLVNP